MNGFLRVHRSAKDQSAQTPDSIKELVSKLLGTSKWYDPCPENPVRDGLVSRWRSVNYVNPPFKECKAWIDKGIQEFRNHEHESLFLVPARTHTKYFHDLVFPEAYTILFLMNSVVFKGYTSALPVPLMMIWFSKRSLPALRNTYRVPCMTLNCPGGDVNETTFPMLRDMYGQFEYESLNAKDPDGLKLRGKRHLVCVMDQPAEHVKRVLQYHAEARSNVVTVIMLVCRFNAAYFRELVAPRAKEIIFFNPVLSFDSGSSYLGSMAITLTNSDSAPKSKFKADGICLFHDNGSPYR